MSKKKKFLGGTGYKDPMFAAQAAFFSSWPRNFHMPQVRPKINKPKIKTKKPHVAMSRTQVTKTKYQRCRLHPQLS